MGIFASIDIVLANKQPPKEILIKLLENGWSYTLEGGEVRYVNPKEPKEPFNWLSIPSEELILENFLNLHDEGEYEFINILLI